MPRRKLDPPHRPAGLPQSYPKLCRKKGGNAKIYSNLQRPGHVCSEKGVLVSSFPGATKQYVLSKVPRKGKKITSAAHVNIGKQEDGRSIVFDT